MSGHVQKTLRLALIQLSVTANKQNNLNHARKLISEAATKITQKQPKGGAPLVVLPECFNSPYGKILCKSSRVFTWVDFIRKFMLMLHPRVYIVLDMGPGELGIV